MSPPPSSPRPDALARAARPAPATSQTRRRWRSIVLLALATALFWASLYLYVPILPVYAGLLGASLPTIGLLVGIYGLGQLLLRVPIGVWSDRLRRRRPFVAGGLVAALLAAVVLALAGDPAGLIVGRALTGVAAAAWVVFAVLFASYYPPERAAYAVSVINFVNIAAQAVATSGGSLLAQAAGWQAPFWGAAGLAALGLVALVGVEEAPLVRSAPLTLAGILRVIGRPTLLAVATTAMLCTAVNFATSFGFVPVFADQLGASRADLGTITAVRLVPFAGATLATAWVVQRWGARWTVLVGCLLLAAANALTPLAPDLAALTIVQALGGLGLGLSSPVLMGLSISGVPPEERATAMGAFQALYAIGMLLGPAAAGWLAAAAGLGAVFIAAAAVALLAGALVTLAVRPT